MSIPKEPRQLMINLMYLVLTALLALNVSAEVMNAFFTLDEGNKASIQTVNSQLDQTVSGLKDLLNDDSKAKYRPIAPAIDQVRASVVSLDDYINKLRDRLIDEAGDKDGSVGDGDYIESYGKRVPKGKKNKDITTRILVDEGVGEELKIKVMEARDGLSKAYADLVTEHGKTFGLKENEIKSRAEGIKNNLTLSVDDETWKGTEKKSWSDFKFRQMPLAAVLPLLSQMQSDAKSSEAAVVNNMAELAGGRVVEFDAFFPVVQAKKAYVIKGEPFEADISIGTYSTQINPSDISIVVDGKRLSVGSDGKAKYKAGTGTIGTKTLKMKVAVTNPLTGETTPGDGTYTYEVGERSIAVSADKMNVFYIGVENPVSVSAAGISSNDLKVSASGVSIKKVGSNNYMVTATKPSPEVRINVSGGGVKDSKIFRVKRIPDPVARLSKSSGGAMGNGEFKAQGGVGAFLDNFDFDAKCKIQGYTLTYVAKRQDPVDSVNQGARYNAKSKRLVGQAKPGDIFYFDNVKARCPGDAAGRTINSMVFKIK